MNVDRYIVSRSQVISVECRGAAYWIVSKFGSTEYTLECFDQLDAVETARELLPEVSCKFGRTYPIEYNDQIIGYGAYWCVPNRYDRENCNDYWEMLFIGSLDQCRRYVADVALGRFTPTPGASATHNRNRWIRAMRGTSPSEPT